VTENKEIMDLLTAQHDETQESTENIIRLLELFTAEQRVSNVKTGMLDETLKKVLISMKTFGSTANDLLNEFK